MESPATSDGITKDTTCSLSTLRAQAGKPLRDVLLRICADHRADNNKSVEFIKNLKCFLPVETSDGRAGLARPMTLRACLQDKGYVALSYPWDPAHGESNKKGGYLLPDGRSPVRDVLLYRTSRFIRHKQRSRGIIPFWCDQLSMDQSNKETGMQSMDLVYKQCTFAVGYLWVEMKTKVQIDRLSSLLGGRILKCTTEPFPVLDEHISAQTAGEILDVLVQITDDPWWSRAWIYQEDYLAGTKMYLLIRRAQGLHIPCALDALGDLPGELVVKSDQFKKYATLFCLALCQNRDQSPSERSACEKVLQKAGKYNILDKIGSTSLKEKAMTIRILDDLNKRNITVSSDLLAITANVCSYNHRILAPKEDPTQRISLSLAVLALYISNGEMIRNDYRDGTLYENIFGFLEKHRVPIDAPIKDGSSTFSKHCRLSISHLSPDGIHTRGILWKLSAVIRPDRYRKDPQFRRKSSSQKELWQSRLSDYQRRRLFDLVRLFKQRHYERLADDLETYLKHRMRSLGCDDWPPEFAMDLMAACVVNAMDRGDYLQVAHSVRQSPGHSRGIPYRAVFVRKHCEIQRSGPSYIFTSWSRTKDQVQDTTKCRSLAKYVSMEVSANEITSVGVTGLKIKGWVNGLCFFNGGMGSSFMFPWPDSLRS